MRGIRALLSSFTNVTNQLVRAVLSLVTRQLFMSTIGASILGLNSTFTSLVSVLSLSELGIGTAIGVCLYKPIAENDIDKILSYADALKRFNRFMMLVYAVGGMVLTPLALKSVNGDYEKDFIVFVYALFIISLVTSYYKAFYRTLLSVDQKAYIVTGTDTIISIVVSIGQIISIVVFQSYYLYLFTTIVTNIIGNEIISQIANKQYTYLRNKPIRLGKEEKKDIWGIVKNLFVYKFATYLVQGVDNLIISVMLGTISVAYYGNYYLIVSMLYAIVSGIVGGFVAGIGNVLHTQKERLAGLLNQIQFMQFIIYGSTAVAMILLSTDFVVFFFGEESRYGQLLVVMLGTYYFLLGLFDSLELFRYITGEYPDRYKQLAVAGINLVISIVFARVIGVAGVVLGTVFCYLLKGLVLTPSVIFGKYIDSVYRKEYLLKALKYIVMYVVFVGISFFVPSFDTLNFFYRCLLRGIIGFGYVIAFIYVIFRKNSVYVESMTYFKGLLGKIINKLKV